MQAASPDNHAAAAWVAGTMDPALRPEFEAHLASCAECQAEVAALRARQTQQLPKLVVPTKVEAAPQAASGKHRRVVLIVAAAIATLIAGFALGWSVWQMAHR